MTLGRQLLLAFISMVVLVIAGAFIITVNNTRDYLDAQLESNAHDAAVSLGMALSAIVYEDDEVLIERTVDSLFDGGYYQQIIVKSLNGDIHINLQSPTLIEGIPVWFLDRISLEPPLMKALVMGGWSEWGSVEISSNPGYAYEQLWHSFVENLMLALLAIVFTIVIVALLLKIILTPLKQIEGQARAIANREYPILETIPKTREFRSVVFAMNKMATKLTQMVSVQSMVAKNLKKESYSDPVTGLGNRRSLLMRLDQMTKQSDDTQHGALAMLKVDKLGQINRDQSFAAGNEIITSIATKLVESLGPNPHIFRMGAVFGILFHHLSESDIEAASRKLMAEVSGLRFGEIDQVSTHMGIAIYSGSQSASDLLSSADMALLESEKKGPHRFEMLSTGAGAIVKGSEAWRESVLSIIQGQRIDLVYQPVRLFANNKVVQYEALARFTDEDGAPIPPGSVFPIAERYQLCHKLDRVIAKKILNDLGKPWAQSKYLSMNLSMQSIADGFFIEWLAAELLNHKKDVNRLIIEISEQQFHSNRESFEKFIDRFRKMGISFSIDQFGINDTAFGYLQSVKIDQLKVDGSYIHGLHQNKDNQFFLRSLTTIVHNLDIKILANFVEHEQELQSIESLGLDGAQGYYIGKPEIQG